MRPQPRLPLFVLPAVHLSLRLVIQQHPTEGSWTWFPMFLVDFPASLLAMLLGYVLPPLAAFGIVGTVWWYQVSKFIRFLYHLISK